MIGGPVLPIQIVNRWREIGANNPQPPHIRFFAVVVCTENLIRID
jgi:hypothetical protein